MEIAVNINKKLWEEILRDFKESGHELKTDQCKAWILGYLQNCSQRLIGQKAVDQVHRRLVIEKLKQEKPRKVREYDEFDRALKDSNKFHYNQEKHSHRGKHDRRKINGKFYNLDVKKDKQFLNKKYGKNTFITIKNEISQREPRW